MVKPTIDTAKLRLRVAMIQGKDTANNLKIDVASNIDNKAIFVTIENIRYSYDVFDMIDECVSLYLASQGKLRKPQLSGKITTQETTKKKRKRGH